MAIFITLLMLTSAEAAMPHQDYIQALKIADQSVMNRRAEAAAKSPIPVFYPVGTWWEVAVVRVESPIMRMTGEPGHLREREVKAGVFRYEVLADGVVSITQKDEPGTMQIDLRVSRILLEMKPIMGQRKESKKTYAFRGQDKIVSVSPDAVRSRISPLEMLPLELPDLSKANWQRAKEPPEIPSEFRGFLDSSSLKIESALGVMAEDVDFFGRPIYVLWQQGDPWATFMKTPQGISILLAKGGV